MRVTLASAAQGFSALPAIVAERLGYFSEVGLELDFVGSDGGPGAARSVLAGEIDFGMGGLWRPLMYSLGARSDRLVVHGQIIARTFVTLVGTRAAELTAIEELAGVRVLTPWGSPSAPSILVGAVKERVPDEPPVLVQGFDAAESVDLLERGLAPFAMIGSLDAYRLAHAGRVEVVEPLARLCGPVPYGVVYARSGTDRHMAAAFFAALQRGRAWLTEQTPLLGERELVEVAGPGSGVRIGDGSLDALVATATAGSWAGGLGIGAESHERMQRMLVDHGTLDAPVAVARYYDPTVADEVDGAAGA